MKILEVPYFKQDTGYTCGPTSLQMVLAYFGVHESESKLAESLSTTKEVGTTHENMIEGVRKHGLHCYVNDNATIHELSYLLGYEVPVIVRFVEPSQNEDHYGVVIGLNDTHAIVHDPWNGEAVKYEIEDFLGRWICDELGDCAQWLMAVSKHSLPLGRQYHPYD